MMNTNKIEFQPMLDFEVYYVQAGLVPGLVSCWKKDHAIALAESIAARVKRDIKVFDRDFTTLVYKTESYEDQ